MKVDFISQSFDQELYNSNATHPLQAWEWGEARKATGIDVIRLGEFDGTELKNVYQITLHPLPKLSYRIGYLPRSTMPSQAVLDFLYDYGTKYNILFFKIEPYVKKDESGKLNELMDRIKPSPHPLFPAWTQMLDISPSEEDLLKNMHQKTRYNIRLAERKGVTVKEVSNEKGFETFNKLYFETTKRQKYFGHTPQYHEIIWEHLQKSMAHILIAYYEDKPLAAYELFNFNGVFYYPYGGSSNEHRNVMATNLLMWEAIRLGKRLGAKTFDMWGSTPPTYSQNDSWAGFTRFKEGYGTNFVEMVGSYELVVKPFYYQLYNIAHKLRKILLRFRA